MDTLSIVVLLLIAFIGFSQGITWLFVGALVLIVIASRSLGVAVLIIVGVGTLYLLNLHEYWYVLLILIVVILILTKGLTEQGAAGAEGMYSPELMQLLGGGGGGY